KFGNRSLAADAAGISYLWLSQYINNDPEFAEEWSAARAKYIATLEREAHRRAIEGWDEVKMGPQGPYAVTKFDSALLQMLLKANWPEKYREQLKVEQETTVRTPL